MSNNGRAGVLLYELLAISQWVRLCHWADLVSAHFVHARHEDFRRVMTLSPPRRLFPSWLPVLSSTLSKLQDSDQYKDRKSVV